MALYKLTGVKIDREEGGKRKSYKIGDTIDMTTAQAKEYAWGIEPVMQPVSAPIPLVPDNDDDQEDDTGDDTSVDLSILDRNAPEVIDRLDTLVDDEEALTALREAEVKGKNRKSVLDAIDGLIGE